uniref:C2H2-type domain-containing protein n=2 Tax=Clastoptera arizonana TaxID=38151 RepID=A0A1B6CHA5_9HEMI
MNFAPFPSHLASMHTLSSPGKHNISQSNTGTIIVSSVNTSHFHHSASDNHSNYSNNNDTVSSAVLPNNHHHLIGQNNISHSTTAAQSNWLPIGLNRNANELIKSSFNIPSFTVQNSTQTPIHTFQWPLKTVITQNVSTMTDLEKPENLSKSNSKYQGFSEESNDSSKSSINDNQHMFWSENCSKIHLKAQENVMAEYLARLHPSPLPLNIQQFLQRHNIKIISNSNNSDKKQSNKVKSCDIKISAERDGSTLFCCPECHMVFARRDLLEQHLSVHKGDRKFECNLCGISLKRKEHLDQHKRGHSEERPFICVICCKGFKRNEHLRRHISIHAGDKTHVCNECVVI